MVLMALLSRTYQILLLLILFTTASLTADEAPLYEVNVGKYLMGTRVDASVMVADVNAAKKGLYLAFQEMERIEALLGYKEATSEISRINRQAGVSAVKVSPETFEILQRAVQYSEQFAGLFDISIGVLSEVWGFNSNQDIAMPAPETLLELKALVSFRQIKLNSADSTVFLEKTGMKIDLGGIAKGYAIDRAVAVLRDNGINNFLLNAGGDIFVSGSKGENTDWQIGIKHPRENDQLAATFAASDMAVATSGDYERYIDVNGRRYHHILDPRTAYPAIDCQSVSALAPTAEQADVIATYLFILGEISREETLPEIAQNHIIIDATGKLLISPSFQKNYQINFPR